MEDSLRKVVDACISRQPGNPLWPDGVERFCKEHGLTEDKFYYRFAQLVAEDFVHGLMSYNDGDRAMNRLFGVADIELRGFAWDVYEAFDSGEFRHNGDTDAVISWQKYTLPQVMEALVREGHAGEGHNGLARRFAGWEKHNGVSLEGAPLYASQRPAQLCSARAAAEVANAVEQLYEQNAEEPVLIVVDTLARNFGGADENSAQDMGAFIANLDQFLRARWRATVLIVHHSGHADKTRARGSTALKGALDAEYAVSKDSAGVVRIEATKMKDAEQPSPMAFKMERVLLGGLEDGGVDEVTSVALSCVSYISPAKPGKVGRGRNQTLALGLLAALCREHQERLLKSGHNPQAARVKIDEWRDRLAMHGVDRKRFFELRNTLSAAGLIVVEFGDYVRTVDSEDSPF